MPEAWRRVNEGKSVELGDLASAAKELLRATQQKVWLMNGEMGAGKTTLTKALCEELGVEGTMSSPTFSIVNEYQTKNKEVVYHFDFYRLKNETEAMDIGVEEYLDSGNYCFLEWPDKIANLIPTDHFEVNIKEHTPTSRTIEYLAHE
jgi:tRNA threonylcarbamoyladenosine biosynthesis protein TsaE